MLHLSVSPDLHLKRSHVAPPAIHGHRRNDPEFYCTRKSGCQFGLSVQTLMSASGCKVVSLWNGPGILPNGPSNRQFSKPQDLWGNGCNLETLVSTESFQLCIHYLPKQSWTLFPSVQLRLLQWHRLSHVGWFII